MTRFLVAVLLVWGISGTVLAQEATTNFKTIDYNSDLKVDSNEHRKWTSSCSVAFSKKYSSESTYYLPPKLSNYVKKFDTDQDGRLSNLEYRRFQVESKKMFSAVRDLIMKEFDSNKNSRLEKEEKEVAQEKVGKLLRFTFNLTMRKNEDGTYYLRRKRSVTDIYD